MMISGKKKRWIASFHLNNSKQDSPAASLKLMNTDMDCYAE